MDLVRRMDDSCVLGRSKASLHYVHFHYLQNSLHTYTHTHLTEYPPPDVITLWSECAGNLIYAYLLKREFRACLTISDLTYLPLLVLGATKNLLSLVRLETGIVRTSFLVGASRLATCLWHASSTPLPEYILHHVSGRARHVSIARREATGPHYAIGGIGHCMVAAVDCLAD